MKRILPIGSSLIIILTQFSTLSMQAQTEPFRGGIGDGYSSFSSVVTGLDGYSSGEIFVGGVGDGFSSLMATGMRLDGSSGVEPFRGGIGDGHEMRMTQEDIGLDGISPTVVFIGGSSDGYSSSQFYVGGLPVQLASFTARLITAGVTQLSWTTISETNNYGFYIERRAASETQFTELPNSFIPGHGTTNEPRHYSFVDSTITPGVSMWYYRLKQVDLDGTLHLTEPISVSIATGVERRNEIPKSFSLSQNYPNPFNPRTTIEFGLPRQTHVVIEVFNILGQRVALLVSEVRVAGYHQVPFDAGGLSSGMYVYRISAGDFVQTKKLLLLQ